MKAVAIAVSSFLVGVSCGQVKPLKQDKNSISRIVIASSTCFGRCHSFALQADSSLTFRYYGGKFAKKQGFYQGKVSPAVWDTLVQHLDGVDLDKLDSAYTEVMDAISAELILETPNRTYHFTGSPDEMPIPLRKLHRWAFYKAELLSLHTILDTVDFGTTAQYPPVPPTIMHQ